MFIRNIQFVIFGDFRDIDAQPEKIINISTKLLENGISAIPGTFQQMNPSVGMKAFERIMYTNTKEKYNIQIGMDKIQVNKAIVDNKLYNFVTETELFLSKLKKIIKSLKDSEQGLPPGYRVSLIIDILHDKEKLKPFNEIYNSFNNKLPNYDADETFEWNTRAVKRNTVNVLGLPEVMNIVSEVSRVNGEVNVFGQTEQFDTIQAKIDINTIDENRNLRVTDEFISQFLTYSYDLFTSQYNDIEVKIIGSNRGF